CCDSCAGACFGKPGNCSLQALVILERTLLIAVQFCVAEKLPPGAFGKGIERQGFMPWSGCLPVLRGSYSRFFVGRTFSKYRCPQQQPTKESQPHCGCPFFATSTVWPSSRESLGLRTIESDCCNPLRISVVVPKSLPITTGLI